MAEDNRTLAQLAQEALDIQDACNLSGLVHGWSRSISRLRKLLPNAGTDEINRHPINGAWADKCHDITGRPSDGLFQLDNVFEKCAQLAKGDK